MRVTVQYEDKSVTIEDRRGVRMLLILVRLLGRIRPMEQGKLTLSWSGETDPKWSVENFGRGCDLSIESS